MFKLTRNAWDTFWGVGLALITVNAIGFIIEKSTATMAEGNIKAFLNRLAR